MPSPYEIIVSPYEVWLAPVGEAFPDVDETPAGNWAKLGTNGNCNYSDDGVQVTHEQEFSEIFTLCSNAPAKISRSSEAVTVGLTLLDVSIEQYAKILNFQTLTDTPAAAGVPGTREIWLEQGVTVQTRALLCRGISPYGDNLTMQYQVPVVYQAENPAPIYHKEDPAGLLCLFRVLADTSASEGERFGKLIAQYADAL
jgi:hypothetical protein